MKKIKISPNASGHLRKDFETLVNEKGITESDLVLIFRTAYYDVGEFTKADFKPQGGVQRPLAWLALRLISFVKRTELAKPVAKDYYTFLLKKATSKWLVWCLTVGRKDPYVINFVERYGSSDINRVLELISGELVLGLLIMGLEDSREVSREP